ncbi:MAG: hypothetical protein L0154_17635 [Chloroflexi bacterium]|nr:hypothetical protein [Chloroflexota bacterium]
MTDHRLRQINDAIKRQPNRALNYVLRGEYWLKQREPYLAVDDFEMALEVAMHELAASDWDYREQTVIDRARRGLRLAEQY